MKKGTGIDCVKYITYQVVIDYASKTTTSQQCSCSITQREGYLGLEQQGVNEAMNVRDTES